MYTLSPFPYRSHFHILLIVENNDMKVLIYPMNSISFSASFELEAVYKFMFNYCNF